MSDGALWLEEWCPCRAAPGSRCRLPHPRKSRLSTALHVARGWRAQPCPTCKAAAGQRCRTPSGREASRTHEARPRPGRHELLRGEDVWQELERRGATIATVLFGGRGGRGGRIERIVLSGVDGDEPIDLELALIENIARADLTVIEEAHTIASLLDDLNVSWADLARRLGRSRSDLAHTVRLLELPDRAIELIDSGRLTKGHGKALLTEPDHDRRRRLAHRALDNEWSVRDLEAEIIRGQEPHSARAAPHPDQLAAAATLEDTISRALGVDIQARPHRDGYRLVLDQTAGHRLVQILRLGLHTDERAT